MGYLYALIAVFSFGTYMIPLKRWPSLSSWAYLALAAVGILASALVPAVYFGTMSLNLLGIFSGFFWVAGGALCFWAVQEEAGLSGSGTRAVGTAILTSFLCAVLILREKTHLYLSLPAILLILGGLYTLDPIRQNPLKNWRSFGAGIVFGTYLVPYQMRAPSSQEFMFSLSFGIFIAASVLFLFTVSIARPKGKVSPLKHLTPGPVLGCLIAGIVWTVGQQACLVALSRLGFAIGYPMTQLNLLVSLFCGVVFFGEFPSVKMRIRLLCASSLIVSGAFVLSFSRINV
ncbi:MAG: GRP family sugar transporter [Fibrobacter sp.]|jgi:glucose uptake protein|nr:GRP family sugar transporter [Fibrobacter sp.]